MIYGSFIVLKFTMEEYPNIENFVKKKRMSDAEHTHGPDNGTQTVIENV